MSLNSLEGKTWKTQCQVCGQQYANGCGSTPCCGSLQFIIPGSIQDRACDPRPGDRWIELDGVTTSEITAVDEMGGGITDPEINQIVSYTHSQTGPRVHQMLLGEYRQLVKDALKGGHTFHAVEDDEE